MAAAAAWGIAANVTGNMGYFPALGGDARPAAGGAAGPPPMAEVLRGGPPKAAWGAAAPPPAAPPPPPPVAGVGAGKWEVLGRRAADAEFAEGAAGAEEETGDEEEYGRPTERVFFDFDTALAASQKQKGKKSSKGKKSNKGQPLFSTGGAGRMM